MNFCDKVIINKDDIILDKILDVTKDKERRLPRYLILNFHLSSNTLVTQSEELTHWKRP